MRNSFLVVLLFAGAALATSSAVAAALASSSAATDASKDVVPSCAPLDDVGPDKPTSGSVAPGAKPDRGSANGKSGAADDDDDDDDDDAKDFPPLKPGEHFHLIAFSISGSKHIDEDALSATLPEHVGEPFTDAQIKADTDKIKTALIAQHVHFADVTTSFMQREGPDHCVGIVWDIQHIDAFSQLPYQGYWKFGGQTFSGNKALTNEQLEKAIDLAPNERVREGSMSDAVTGMLQAYDKVFPGQTVKIEGKLRLTVKPARVANFEWQITEPPAK
jgi:hypothetical protein